MITTKDGFDISLDVTESCCNMRRSKEPQQRRQEVKKRRRSPIKKGKEKESMSSNRSAASQLADKCRRAAKSRAKTPEQKGKL